MGTRGRGECLEKPEEGPLRLPVLSGFLLFFLRGCVVVPVVRHLGDKNECARVYFVWVFLWVLSDNVGWADIGCVEQCVERAYRAVQA